MRSRLYELSLIEAVPNVQAEIKKDFNMSVDFERAKHLLEANDGAGNTFKATAKPVLIRALPWWALRP